MTAPLYPLAEFTPEEAAKVAEFEAAPTLPEAYQPSPLDNIRAAVAAMTVHITAHPDNVQAITDAAKRPGMPPIEVHESSLVPLDKMYVWTGDQIAGHYNVHAVPEAQS